MEKTMNLLGQTAFVELVMAGIIFGEVKQGTAQCPLSGQSLYGFEVRIFDQVKQTTVAHGSIISYLAVVSGGYSFNQNTYPYTEHNRYLVVGQKCRDMRDFKNPDQWCTQNVTVNQIIPHPKSIHTPDEGVVEDMTRRVFDFSIFLLKEAFTAIDFYPTINLPETPLRFILDISSINVDRGAQKCEIPIYQDQSGVKPFHRIPATVRMVPFHTECIRLYCLSPPTYDDSWHVNSWIERCPSFTKNRANGTQLRAVPTALTVFPPFPSGLNWFEGAPFACNGTSYGQAGVVIRNQKPLNDLRNDFFFVPTYLRVWPWLQAAIHKFGAANWIKPFSIEKFHLQPDKYVAPSRAPVLDQHLPGREPHEIDVLDYENLKLHSGGSISFPSHIVLCSLIISHT